jgi:hypothetical integral membrane protein (TIGR02206 family)
MFQPYGQDHIGVLIVMAVIGFGLVIAVRPLRRLKDDRIVRYIMAGILLVSALSVLNYFAVQSIMLLPVQLCDITLILMIFVLLKEKTNRLVYELAFFWGFAASIQAVITPDLREPFPSFLWFSFFISHCGVVLGAVYLSVRGKVPVTIYSVWRVFLMTNVYVAVVGLINWLFDANFGYLAAKPDYPSVMDYLGPWPYYIFGCEVIAVTSFFICYAFNRWLNQRAGLMNG